MAAVTATILACSASAAALTSARVRSRAAAPRATATQPTFDDWAARAALDGESFEGWAQSAGISAPKLRIDDLEELRGTMLREPAMAGEELCRLPRVRTLDLATVRDGSPCPDLAPDGLWDQLAWYERLAVWLLAERSLGPRSAVSGYISYLPQPGCASFYDAPLHWTEEELKELQYPALVSAVYEQRDQIRSLHARLRGTGGSAAGSVTLDAVTWAEQVVWSRAFASTTLRTGADGAPAPAAPPPREMEKKVLFEAEWLGKLKGMLPGGDAPFRVGAEAAAPPLEAALMPMLDALNHASSASVACNFDPEAEAFVLSTLRPLAEGEQAFLSYGDKGNDELLQLFGFVEEGNPHDNFLCIGLDEQARAECAKLFPSGAEVERRFELVQRLGLAEALALPEVGERTLPAPTMHALRVLLGSAVELDDDLAKLRRPASLATEERCWAALRAYCKAARAAMGTSRKTDQAALGRRDLSTRQQLALQYRSEKKRLLSALESRLLLVATRSKKAGRPLKL